MEGTEPKRTCVCRSKSRVATRLVFRWGLLWVYVFRLRGRFGDGRFMVVVRGGLGLELGGLGLG